MPGSKPDLASRRAVAGAILAQGAPLGWLGLRWAFSGSPPAQELARSPGLYLYLLLSTTAAFAAFGFVLGAYEESLADASERIARLTRTDPLTRLGNARALGEELPRLASLAKRSGLPLSVVVVDIDRLRAVNERFGEAEGDEVLRRAAQAIAADRRAEDVVARAGGDEFALVLPGVDAAGAARVAGRVLEAVRRIELDVEGVPLHVEASAGVATFERADDPRGLLARAEASLAAAKRSRICS